MSRLQAAKEKQVSRKGAKIAKKAERPVVFSSFAILAPLRETI
jgi:hypothetical protein